MSELDLGAVINLIMENPELVSKIKGLAEESHPTVTEVESPPTVAEPTRAADDKGKAEKRGARRGELLRALSPYISDNRKKAIETFMSIADILDLMRAK